MDEKESHIMKYYDIQFKMALLGLAKWWYNIIIFQGKKEAAVDKDGRRIMSWYYTKPHVQIQNSLTFVFFWQVTHDAIHTCFLPRIFSQLLSFDLNFSFFSCSNDIQLTNSTASKTMEKFPLPVLNISDWSDLIN